jgi:hypothetical protein
MLKKLMLLPIIILTLIVGNLQAMSLWAKPSEIMETLHAVQLYADELAKHLVQLQAVTAVPGRDSVITFQEKTLHEWAVYAAYLATEIDIVAQEQLQDDEMVKLQRNVSLNMARWAREKKD